MPHGVMVNTMVFGAIVPGSSPGEATIKCSSSSVGSECLATNEEVAGSSPAWSTKQHTLVAQWLARLPDTQKVVCSSHTKSTKMRDAWRWFPERSHKPQTWVRVPLPQPHTLVAQ